MKILLCSSIINQHSRTMTKSFYWWPLGHSGD